MENTLNFRRRKKNGGRFLRKTSHKKISLRIRAMTAKKYFFKIGLTSDTHAKILLILKNLLNLDFLVYHAVVVSCSLILSRLSNNDGDVYENVI